MDILDDDRARTMRKRGATFREIAADSHASLSDVREALRNADGGRMRRAMNREIREAGGLKTWWER